MGPVLIKDRVDHRRQDSLGGNPRLLVCSRVPIAAVQVIPKFSRTKDKGRLWLEPYPTTR